MDKYSTIVNGLPKSLMLNAFHIFISIPLHNFNTLLVCPEIL